jgi:hypothetical protein
VPESVARRTQATYGVRSQSISSAQQAERWSLTARRRTKLERCRSESVVRSPRSTIGTNECLSAVSESAGAEYRSGISLHELRAEMNQTSPSVLTDNKASSNGQEVRTLRLA